MHVGWFWARFGMWLARFAVFGVFMFVFLSCSLNVREFYMNFTNPMSFGQSPPEIRDTGVRLK